MSDIRLYMLQTGSIKCKVHNIKMNQGNGADYEIPIPFFYSRIPRVIRWLTAVMRLKPQPILKAIGELSQKFTGR